MKAAVLTRAGEIVMASDWLEPEPGRREVVVELSGIGLGGSDQAVWSGRQPVDLPWIIGHEGVGTIVAVGKEVDAARIGERVVIEPNYPCGACESCLPGRTATCSRRRSLGINTPGLLRERVAIPSQFAWRAPDGPTDEDLVCVESMAVALHAARLGKAASGTRCLIVGAGSQGLLLLLVLRTIGAAVAVTEPHQGRMRMARAMGALRETGETTYDLVFETSGSVGGTQRALRSLATGGTLVLIGIPHEEVPLSTALIVRGHAAVLGSVIYDHPGDFRDTLALIAGKSLSPSSILRRTFGFADSQAALSASVNDPGKSWIKF
jgi:L-gulonate 5-dehydrogenase